MESNKISSKEIIHFYLNNVFSSDSFCRNFSENIFLNFATNLNSPFLILAILTCDFKNKTYVEWLVVFMKRSLFFFSNIFTKNNLIKLVETMIELATTSNDKMYKLVEENVKFLLYSNRERENLNKLAFSFAFKILEEKINIKRSSTFTKSILSVILSIISLNIENLGLDYFNFLSWLMSDFLTKISNLNRIYLGEYHFKCILLCERIFEEIKNGVSYRKTSFDNVINILTLFANFYFSITHPHLYKKSLWNTIGNIENVFFFSIQNLEKEMVTFFPMFLVFFFFDKKKKCLYINSSKILLLNFIIFSDTFSRIFKPKESIRLLILIFKNILSIKTISYQSLNYHLKIFSVEERLNYLAKRDYLNQILNSIDFNKSDRVSLRSIDFIDIFFIFKHSLFNEINTLYTISLINGNSFKGIIINRYDIRIKKEIHRIIKPDLFKNSEQELSFIIDFGNTYRYQLPIINILNIVKFILKKKISEYTIGAHLFNFLERILCIRGNDGVEIILIDFNCSYLKKKINVSNLKLEDSFISTNIISKLLMRINYGLESNNEYEKTCRITLLCKILKKVEIEKECLNSIVFIMEIIFLIIKNSTIFKSTLCSSILDFSNKMIFKNQQENLPYIFEIFTNLSLQHEDNFLDKIKYNLFLGICNPHVWCNSNTVRLMIKFVLASVLKFPLIILMEKKTELLKIIKFIFKKHKKISNVLLLELMSIFFNVSNYFCFLPHFFELLRFFGNYAKSLQNQKSLIIVLLVNLKNTSFLNLEKIIDKLKIKGLIYLIDELSRKSTSFLFATETIFLFETIFKNDDLEKNKRFIRLRKIIMRNLIDKPWRLEKIVSKNNKKNTDYSRSDLYEVNLFHFKKLKIFLNSFFFFIIY